MCPTICFQPHRVLCLTGLLVLSRSCLAVSSNSFPALLCYFFILASYLQSFMCTMAEASLRQHAESKHAKSTFELCFPTYGKA